MFEEKNLRTLVRNILSCGLTWIFVMTLIKYQNYSNAQYLALSMTEQISKAAPFTMDIFYEAGIWVFLIGAILQTVVTVITIGVLVKKAYYKNKNGDESYEKE